MFKQKIFLNKFHYVCPSECCKQDLVFLFCPRCRYRYHTVHNIIWSYRSDVLQYFSFFKVKICFNFTSHICCFVLKYYIFLLQWHLQLPAEWRTPHPPGLPAWWGQESALEPGTVDILPTPLDSPHGGGRSLKQCQSLK